MGTETTVLDAEAAVDTGRVPRLDTVHRVLADRHRRFVLRDLVAHFHPVAVRDVAGRAVTELYGGTDEQVHRDLERSLADEHLPLLESAGLIQFVEGRAELTTEGLAVGRLSRACTEYVERSAADC